MLKVFIHWNSYKINLEGKENTNKGYLWNAIVQAKFDRFEQEFSRTNPLYNLILSKVSHRKNLY